jgi:hypothetical protein
MPCILGRQKYICIPSTGNALVVSNDNLQQVNASRCRRVWAPCSPSWASSSPWSRAGGPGRLAGLKLWPSLVRAPWSSAFFDGFSHRWWRRRMREARPSKMLVQKRSPDANVPAAPVSNIRIMVGVQTSFGNTPQHTSLFGCSVLNQILFEADCADSVEAAVACARARIVAPLVASALLRSPSAPRGFQSCAASHQSRATAASSRQSSGVDLMGRARRADAICWVRNCNAQYSPGAIFLFAFRYWT